MQTCNEILVMWWHVDNDKCTLNVEEFHVFIYSFKPILSLRNMQFCAILVMWWLGIVYPKYWQIYVGTGMSCFSCISNNPWLQKSLYCNLVSPWKRSTQKRRTIFDVFYSWHDTRTAASNNVASRGGVSDSKWSNSLLVLITFNVSVAVLWSVGRLSNGSTPASVRANEITWESSLGPLKWAMVQWLDLDIHQPSRACDNTFFTRELINPILCVEHCNLWNLYIAM